MTLQSNPLLQPFDFPPYDQIKPEHVEPAARQLADTARNQLLHLLDHLPSTLGWDDLVLAVDAIDAPLEDLFELLAPLRSLGHEWSDAVDVCYGELSSYRRLRWSEPRLQAAFQQLESSPVGHNLLAPRRRTLARILEGFDIPPVAVEQAYAAAEVRLDVLRDTFFSNLDSTWYELIDDATRLAGLPADVLARMRKLPEQVGLEGWVVSLDPGIRHAVLTYADDRDLRETVYRAQQVRASTPGKDNLPVMVEILQLRHEQALRLGYRNHVERRLKHQPVGDSGALTAFYDRLQPLLEPALVRDRQRLQAFAQVPELEPWDLAYQLRRYRAQQLDDARIRRYFPFDQTLERLLDMAGEMFGIEFVARSLPAWHPQVRTFEVTENHAVIGYLYIDALDRPGKDEGAWTQSLRQRHVDAEGRFIRPTAVLNAQLAGDSPSERLLSHQDLRVLTHEFGHCLHQLLTPASNRVLSDIRNLSRGWVELVSQIFERWAWNVDALQRLSGNAPRDVLEEWLVAQRMFSVGSLGAEWVLGQLDMRIHQGGVSAAALADVLKDVPAAFNVVDTATLLRQFDHVLSGYDVSYFSYLWSFVLAVDAFEVFEAEGVTHRQTATRLRETLFARGRWASFDHAFEAFRGRPSRMDAFVRAYGLS